jgi:hypothetical protein
MVVLLRQRVGKRLEELSRRARGEPNVVPLSMNKCLQHRVLLLGITPKTRTLPRIMWSCYAVPSLMPPPGATVASPTQLHIIWYSTYLTAMHLPSEIPELHPARPPPHKAGGGDDWLN